MTDSTNDLISAVDAFAAARPRLFGIAYRMLGSVAESEDVLQEAWLRWQGSDRSAVENPPAFLATVVTRLSMNLAASARMRHETYIGPWLPDPIDTSADPLLGAERGEAVEFAVLLLLESLTPAERASYVLREAFDYPYPLIAEIVQQNEPAVRQLVSRARKHLAAGRRREAAPREHRRLLDAFLTAARSGDVSALEALFAADIVSTSDGGGAKLAARKSVHGRERVATFIAAFSSHFWLGAELRWVEANGRPAVAILRDGVAATVVTLVASEDGIERLLWLMNPAKLAAVA